MAACTGPNWVGWRGGEGSRREGSPLLLSLGFSPLPIRAVRDDAFGARQSMRGRGRRESIDDEEEEEEKEGRPISLIAVGAGGSGGFGSAPPRK